MVFVTVGNAHHTFTRLLDAIDDLAGTSIFGEERVFVQSGHNEGFTPRHCEHQPFVSGEQFEALMREADVIICHGGCTQLHAIRLGKMPVVVPRLKRWGEHVNDHQLQLVEALHAEGLVIPVYDVKDLPNALIMARQKKMVGARIERSQMLTLIAAAVEELLENHA